ncbi:MAG: ABC transporter ATP-binding protein [Candidatus Dojkabacteria bacterium]|nr:MAG: ABC transporter ATP-binding protein [Candidatus Dojkabacteria bacterium]
MAARKSNYSNSFIEKLSEKPRIFLRYVKYYSSFSPFYFWAGIIIAYIRAPIDSIMIFLGGLFIESIVEYYKDPSDFYLINMALPRPILYVLIMLGLWIVQRIMSALYNICHIRTRHRVWAGSRQDLIERYSTLNLEETDREDIKDEVEKIQHFWWTRAVSLYDKIVSVGDLTINVVFALIAVASFNPILAAIILILPLPEVIIGMKNNKHFREFIDDIGPVMLNRTYIFSVLLDSRTFAEKKVNAIHRILERKFKHFAGIITEGYENAQSKYEKNSTVGSVVDMVLLYSVRIAVVVIGILQQIPVGRISYILGYVDTLYSNIFTIQSSSILLIDDLSYVRRLFDFLDTQGFADSHSGRRILKQSVPDIELRDFSFTYPETGITVLNHASLKISAGEKVLILGKDGSGKSSIIRFIAGLYKIQSGDILFDNVSITALKRRQVKDKLAIVPEDFSRFYMTLKENITIGDPRRPFDAKLFEKALYVAGLDEWVKEMNIDPDGVTIGSYFEGGLEISSGHWQRIAIARAIYRNRDVFVFDQPFTYVDKTSVNVIFPRLMEFIGNRTLILIGEEVIFPEYFTNIYEMGNGQIAPLSRDKASSHWVEGKISPKEKVGTIKAKVSRAKPVKKLSKARTAK